MSILRSRLRAHYLVPAASLCVAVAAGCSDDTSTNNGSNNDNTVPTTTEDAGTHTPTTNPTDAGQDSGITTTDRDTGAPPPQGCALYANADFCDDFDNAGALTAGTTKWDFIEPTDQPVATLSTARAVSTPNSLLSQVIDGSTPGAKFAKTITKNGFTQVSWEYDVYFDQLGASDGFFLDDFQFSDQGGTDNYGFRLVLFAKDNGLDFLRVEHNGGAANDGYAIEDRLPDGTVGTGKWMHFKQDVAFTIGSSDASDTAANKATYTLTVDGTQAFSKQYIGLTRAQLQFARISGMAFVFNKEHSAGLKINWDNHALTLK